MCLGSVATNLLPSTGQKRCISNVCNSLVKGEGAPARRLEVGEADPHPCRQVDLHPAGAGGCRNKFSPQKPSRTSRPQHPHRGRTGPNRAETPEPGPKRPPRPQPAQNPPPTLTKPEKRAYIPPAVLPDAIVVTSTRPPWRRPPSHGGLFPLREAGFSDMSTDETDNPTQ